MADAISSIDAEVYRTPSPEAVARLVESHGLEAATMRRPWMGVRTLSSLARQARAAGGCASTVSRARSYIDDDAAICCEAAFILGSVRRGERAAGLTAENVGRGIVQARGLTPPAISAEERGRAARIGHAANAGDPTAIAEREDRLAHEKTVGAVLRRALALVPTQPATGRYVLPPCDDALRTALAGLPEAAVAAVFPAFALPEPDPAEPEETLVTKTTDRPGQRRGRLPDENVIRCDHADGQPLLVLAKFHGVAPQTLYAQWRQYGLSGQGRLAGYAPAFTANRRTATQGRVHAPEARLGLEDLTVAAGLVRRGVQPAEAVALVRADVAACTVAPDKGAAAWFDAVVECGLAETEVERSAADARYALACEAFGVPQ